MIYLDNNSTTPLDPRVLARMLPFFEGKWGNASSREHAFGWDAREAVEDARSEVAALLNARQNEIFFTSGATESIHLALHGLFPNVTQDHRAPTSASTAGGILTSRVEHEAVLSTCAQLNKRGVPVSFLEVDPTGQLDLTALASACASHRPKVLALLAANNETGVLFPARECAALAHEHGALFFIDAAQALGKVPLDSQVDGFDLAAFSAHKLNGPKGIGALFVRGGREAIPLEPQITGGGQEGGMRGGTLNVPGIVGFGEACRLARLESAEEIPRILVLRNRLESALISRFPEIRINGDREHRLATTSNLRFPGIDARILIRDMHDVAVSTRAACSSGSSEPSHVLKAMRMRDEDAFASVRFSLGRFTTEAEIDQAIEKTEASYRKLRGLSTTISPAISSPT